ncbi:hypothetical protein BGW80DRAFT_58668 [Lactifluus volemus]|nr:hypothetical protein BGW80DRAFT_58668 [Lactifluus volemus]
MPISPSLIKVSPLTPSTSTGPLKRHRNYFIHKADLTIRVENDIFKIHRYFLTRESAHFRLLLSAPTLLGQEPPGSSESNPLVLNDVTSEAFASFLWTFYNPKYSLYEATSDEWCSILELARKWGFRDVEQLCIRELENLDLSPVERIPIYQRFNLSETRLLDCYESLTIRDDPIGVEEGIKLGVRTSVQIACAREVARASETGGGLSPSPVQLRGPGLRSLISEIFQSPPSPTNRTAWSLNTPLSDSNGASDLFTPAPTVRGAPTGGRSTPQLAIQTNGMSSSALTSHRGGSVWQSPAMWSAMATRLDHPLARSTGTRSTSNPVTTLAPQPQSPRAPVGRVWSLGGLGLPSGPEAGVSGRGSSAHLDANKRDFREMPLHVSSV